MTFALWLLAASTPLELCPRRVLAILFLSPCVAVATHGASLTWFFVSVRASTSRVCVATLPPTPAALNTTPGRLLCLRAMGSIFLFVCFCKSRFYFTSWFLVGHEALSFFTAVLLRGVSSAWLCIVLPAQFVSPSGRPLRATPPSRIVYDETTPVCYLTFTHLYVFSNESGDDLECFGACTIDSTVAYLSSLGALGSLAGLYCP